MKATAAIALDKRTEKKNFKYPAKLRITFGRTYRYFATGYDLTEKEHEKVFSNKAKGDLLDAQEEFNRLLKNAQNVIESIPIFSFPEFRRRWVVGAGEYKDIFYRYRLELNELEKNEQYSSADNYRATYLSLVKFLQYKNRGRIYSDEPKLYFSDCDERFLREFQKWFLEVDHIKLKNEQKKYKSRSTLSIYLRTLRKLFNDALRSGEISQQEYPFGENRYQIPKPLNNKKALEIGDIKRLILFECRTPQEQLYVDIWRFSYLCAGINLTDVCRLKYGNLQGGKLSYYRQKNSRHRDQKEIVLSLPAMALEIIARHGSPVHTTDEYIFPFLAPGMTKKQETEKIHEVVKQVNKHVGRVATTLGIEIKITSYVARHSAATILIRKGENIAHIADLLGHTNIATTQAYLAGFDFEQKEAAASKLTDF